MRTFIIGLSVAVALAAGTACDRLSRSGETNATDPNAVSASDQSNAEPDLEVTQRIRQALVTQDGLSVSAQNVVVVTTPGMVTLRGPVPNSEERLKIAAIAREFAGDRFISDQLGVEQN